MSARLGLTRLGWVLLCGGAGFVGCWLVFWAAKPETTGDGVFLCVVLAVAFMTVAALLIALVDVVFWIIDGFRGR